MKTRKTGGWTQTLVTLIAIALPSFFMWLFLSTDWISEPLLPFWITTIIAVCFIFYSFLLTWLLIFLKVAWYDMYNTAVPIAFFMMTILLTQSLPAWSRAVIVIFLVILIGVLSNILTTKYSDYKLKLLEEKERSNH